MTKKKIRKHVAMIAYILLNRNIYTDFAYEGTAAEDTDRINEAIEELLEELGDRAGATLRNRMKDLEVR